MTNWTFLGWFYYRGCEQVGPVRGEEIARLIDCGQLRPCDEVLKAWRDTNNRVRLFGSQADASRQETSPAAGSPV
jgi:hypothetical protein